MDNQELLLHHEVMLLSLRDSEGTPENHLFPFALSTSILSELVLRNRLEISASNESNVSVADSTPTGIKILDECLEKIASHEEQEPLTHWIKEAFDPTCLTNTVTQELCDYGILQKDTKQFLWIFCQTTFPELNPIPERHLKKRLRHLLLDESIEEKLSPDSYERTAAIAILAHATELLDINLEDLSEHLCEQKLIEKLDEISEESSLRQVAKSLLQTLKSDALAMSSMLTMPLLTASVCE